MLSMFALIRRQAETIQRLSLRLNYYLSDHR